MVLPAVMRVMRVGYPEGRSRRSSDGQDEAAKGMNMAVNNLVARPQQQCEQTRWK